MWILVRIPGRISGRAGPQLKAWNSESDRERFRARLGGEGRAKAEAARPVGGAYKVLIRDQGRQWLGPPREEDATERNVRRDGFCFFSAVA